MAEEALRKLGQELSCGICHQPYTTPKLLHCHHVYCQQCLESSQDALSVLCQACSKATPTPRGVADLPNATYANRLLDILKTFETIICYPLSGCSMHSGRVLELYCKNCKILICTHCALKGGRHHKHDYVQVDQNTFTKCTEEFSKPLETLAAQKISLGAALQQVEARSGELAIQCAAWEDKIRSTMTELRDILYDREADLLSQLKLLTQGKVDSLERQKDWLETTQAQLGICMDVVLKSLASGQDGNIVKDKKVIKTQLGDLVKAFRPESLPPCVEADVEFAFQSMSEACKNFGCVYAPSVPFPSRCYLVQKDLEPLVVGDLSVATLQVVDHQGKPFEGAVKSIECELVCETTGANSRGGVERKGQSQYRVVYLASQVGPHKLHVRIQGQHVGGSPFSLDARMSSAKVASLSGHMSTCFLP